jgi:hypothetical protein
LRNVLEIEDLEHAERTLAGLLDDGLLAVEADRISLGR